MVTIPYSSESMILLPYLHIDPSNDDIYNICHLLPITAYGFNLRFDIEKKGEALICCTKLAYKAFARSLFTCTP